MIYGLYSILDHKAGFLPPQVDQNDQTASRNFAHAIMQTGSVLHTHAEDYELYKVGSFDTETGVLSVLSVKELVAEGYSFKEVK